jgi:branched-chain amino acid transport system permease protein
MTTAESATITRVAAAAPAATIRIARMWLVAIAALIAIPLVPGFDTDFARSMLSQMAIAAVFAVSFNVLLGQTGLLSFGHAVYFGLGGYVAIHTMRIINGGWPVPVAVVPLAGALGGLFFGVVIGAFTTRRAGTVFAMITLGLGELVVAASLMLTRFFGGEEGITANRTKALHPFGLTFATQLEVYYLILAWTIVAIGAMYAFTHTPVGRLSNAVRDNPERTAFIGYDPQRVRFIAFAVSATFAGLAGGLHAVNYEIVASEALGAARSGAVLLMAFIGGVGYFVGPILGAIVITWLSVSLSDFTLAWQLYLGLLFIVMVLFAPGGVASLIARHRPLLRAGRLHRIVPAYAVVAVPAALATLGASFLLEVTYRIATKPELGKRMIVYWIPLDAATPWPWLGGLALIALGGVGSWKSAALVRASWERALEGTTVS